MGSESSLTSAHFPGVDRFVAMHQRQVAAEHPSESVLPRLAGLLTSRNLGDLPCCAIGRTQAAVFDDAKQPADLALVSLPLTQACSGQSNSLRTTSSATCTWPTWGQYTSALMPCRIPETKFSSAAWKDIWLQIGRSSVARARTSPAKKAALAMVSTTVGLRAAPGSPLAVRAVVADVVDGSVPTVNSAVVKPQFIQLRYATAVEDRNGILVGADRQQRGKVPGVLLEEVEDRGDPPLAEPHSRPHALGFQLLTASVGALLEQRDAGLRDEVLPEEEWRVRTQGDLHAGDRLGSVPVAGKVVRAHLKMHLGRGAAAAGMIVFDTIAGRSPSMTISRSSPRAAKICWSSIE